MKRWIALCLILFCCSCVSTQIKNQTNETDQVFQEKLSEEAESVIPKYDGAVRPISDSIYAKCMPANIYAKFKFTDFEEIIMKSLISNKVDGLTWSMEFSGSDLGDDTLSCESTTDYRGKISEMKMPRFYKEGINKDIKEMGDFFYFLSSAMFMPEFSSGPIRSGNILYRFPDATKFSGIFGDKDLKLQITSAKVFALLKGWEYKGDQKILVADIRGKMTLRQLNNNLPPLKLLVYGYSLIDSEKFHVVMAEVKYFMENISDDDILVQLFYSGNIE